MGHRRPLAAAVLLANVVVVAAEPVAILNAGFEAPYQDMDVLTGSFPVGPPPTDWTRYDLAGSAVGGSLIGILNPGTQADYDADGAGLSPCFPDGAPQGDNVALLFKSGAGAADEYGIEQTLAARLQPATRYNLTVEVGNIQTCAGLPPGFRTTFNLDGFPGYRIELRAGNDVLVADADSLSPPEGVFETSTITFTAASDDPRLDQPLAIRLVSLNQPGSGLNLEVDFDDVRLEADPVMQTRAVPLPPLALVILGAVLITVQRRRGRCGKF